MTYCLKKMPTVKWLNTTLQAKFSVTDETEIYLK